MREVHSVKWRQMTEDGDESDPYGIGKPLDDDYVDVEKRRADVTISTEQKSDTLDRRGDGAVDTQFSDVSHRFDVSGGNGSASQLDDLIDQNAIIEHDGRAETRTFFYVGEAPNGQKRQYGRMLQYQEDMWSGMKNQQRAADRKRTIETFCAYLDMSEYHKGRVKRICDGLNMSHMAHYSSQKVILAIISLVANEDDRFIRDEDDFRTILRDIDSDLEEVRSIRDLVRRKSYQFE